MKDLQKNNKKGTSERIEEKGEPQAGRGHPPAVGLRGAGPS